MKAGAACRSPEGKFVLVMQGDGNLVLYKTKGDAVWPSNTGGNSHADTQRGPDLVTRSSHKWTEPLLRNCMPTRAARRFRTLRHLNRDLARQFAESDRGGDGRATGDLDVHGGSLPLLSRRRDFHL